MGKGVPGREMRGVRRGELMGVVSGVTGGERRGGKGGGLSVVALVEPDADFVFCGEVMHLFVQWIVDSIIAFAIFITVF